MRCVWGKRVKKVKKSREKTSTDRGKEWGSLLMKVGQGEKWRKNALDGKKVREYNKSRGKTSPDRGRERVSLKSGMGKWRKNALCIERK